jgi:hypothetical protein
MVLARSGHKLIRVRFPFGKRTQENRLEDSVLTDIFCQLGKLAFVKLLAWVGFGLADFRQWNILNGGNHRRNCFRLIRSLRDNTVLSELGCYVIQIKGMLFCAISHTHAGSWEA